MRAMLHYSQGQYPEALIDLDRIIEIDLDGVNMDPIYRRRQSVQERLDRE
jgi:hypothetical protein